MPVPLEAASHNPRRDIAAFGVIDLVPGRHDRVARIRRRLDPATVAEPLAVVSRLILRPNILPLPQPADAARGEVGLGTAVGALATHAEVRVHRLADQLYLRLFIAARRYCHGERSHLYG